VTGSPSPAGLYVQERGPAGAPLVVLVHGSMDRSSGMAGVVRRLEDLRVATYDRRGYGRSRAVKGPRSIDAHVADVLAVLDGRRAVVFGHSLGGDIALAAAERHPEHVSAVGAFEPPMPWESWWPDGTAGAAAFALGAEGSEPSDLDSDAGGAAVRAAEDAAESFMRRMIGDRRWERLPAATRADRRAEGPTLVAELGDVQSRAPFDPAKIEVPVLIACGEHARPQHRRAMAVLAERFGSVPGSVFEHVEVQGVGHGVHFDDPAALAGLVRRVVDMAGDGAVTSD
jgi:pimeloyl-ACP methyl ester carboxylesterase